MTGDPGRPSFFGDVTGEYLALRRDAGVVTGYHDLVWVEGPDAVRFLDGLVSQSVPAMETGEVRRSLLLAPQGKLRAPHHLLRGGHGGDDVRVGLLADAGTGGTVAGDLARFKIGVEVTVEESDRPVVGVWGPGAAGVVAGAGIPVPRRGWHRADDGVVVADVPFAKAPLPRLVVIGVDPDRLVAAGGVRAGRLAVDAVRIEAGEPVMGVDVDERTIPQEGDLVEGAVDFDKGCYLGQELVARIDSRGRVNRTLRGIVLRENVLPPLGAEVVDGDRAIGTMTSLAESLDLRAPVGMGLLRRGVEPGAPVEVRWEGGSIAATVASLPLDVWA